MPQLLLELFSEEIPARMQASAARDLGRMTRERLEAAGLAFESLQTFAGPRRLTLVADGVPGAQADRIDERKGPRVGAPDQAIEGFLRSTGLTGIGWSNATGSISLWSRRRGDPRARSSPRWSSTSCGSFRGRSR